MCISEKSCKSLAVRYCAFIQEHAAGDIEARRTWAGLLLESQRETGVWLQKEETLQFWIDYQKPEANHVS